MSLWELAAAIDGHNRANSSDEKVDPLTENEFDDLLRRHADWIANGSN